MKSEFMREFDFQYEKPLMLSFPRFTHTDLSPVKRQRSISRSWSRYCEEKLEAEEALRAVARLQSEKWWLGKIRRIHDCWREHLMIAAGYVSKVASPYCSDPCFKEWIAQKKRILNTFRRWNWKTGTPASVPLLDKVMGSTSNPKNARAELMVRMRGFEDMAKEMGWLACSTR